MSKIEKIKAELARLKEETSIGLSEYDVGLENGRMEIIDALSNFLDSMKKEPVSNDLEKEIQTTIKMVKHLDLNIDDIVSFCAHHYSKWQKEQMIKNAIETTIVDDWQYGKDKDHTTIPAIHQRIDGCKVGDKVKVIIIKED